MKIQKLDPQDVYSKIDFVSISAMAGKIDELVDAVNELQKNATISKMENVEKPADPYAEQRKWIGKLCKFWDMDEDYYYYGPLTNIGDISPYYYECSHRICYAHCEPVSEDLIYKGE